MCNASSGYAETSYFVVVEMNAMSKPHVGPEPSPLGQDIDGARPETFEAMFLLVDRFAQMGMHMQTVTTSELGRFDHELRRN